MSSKCVDCGAAVFPGKHEETCPRHPTNIRLAKIEERLDAIDERIGSIVKILDRLMPDE